MTKETIPTPWRRILITTAGLLVTQLVGSVFNVWYNLTHIRPLLDGVQAAQFQRSIGIYNICVYPIAFGLWVWMMRSLARAYHSPEALGHARRRAINLPWWVAAIGAPAWALAIPVLLFTLHRGAGEIDPRVNIHLPISITIAALIALTHGFFVIEILTQKLWYPVLFRDLGPAATKGGLRLTIGRRGMLWAISAVVCPIVSLLLIIVVPPPGEVDRVSFALSVGALGILFGFVSAFILGRIVIKPVEELRRAARRVGEGQLDAEVDLPRADEFGSLIDQFNGMIGGLREKRRTEELLGRNVGAEVARVLLERGADELAGAERVITVMFVDIRDFTPRCANCSPRQIVSMLNIFFNHMVETVEGEDGIVNQFTGDGFMAMFGATADCATHADAAVACGLRMLDDAKSINRQLIDKDMEPITIGIGIHTGPAIIGSIGADRRSSYTAVGDTVNVAARIEGHTKLAGEPLLFSKATREALRQAMPATALPPASLKGKSSAIVLYHPEAS